MAGTHDAHGAPLGADEVKATRAALGWEHRPSRCPGVTCRLGRAIRGRGPAAAWSGTFDAIAAVSDRGRRVRAPHARRLDDAVGRYRRRIGRKRTRDHRGDGDAQGVAAGARTAGRGSAGAPRRLGRPDRVEPHGGEGLASARPSGGNYVHYGVREFGMAAIMNGVALHGGFIPYGGTFAFSPTTPATRSAWPR